MVIFFHSLVPDVPVGCYAAQVCIMFTIGLLHFPYRKLVTVHVQLRRHLGIHRIRSSFSLQVLIVDVEDLRRMIPGMICTAVRRLPAAHTQVTRYFQAW